MVHIPQLKLRSTLLLIREVWNSLKLRLRAKINFSSQMEKVKVRKRKKIKMMFLVHGSVNFRIRLKFINLMILLNKIRSIRRWPHVRARQFFFRPAPKKSEYRNLGSPDPLPSSVVGYTIAHDSNFSSLLL